MQTRNEVWVRSSTFLRNAGRLAMLTNPCSQCVAVTVLWRVVSHTSRMGVLHCLPSYFHRGKGARNWYPLHPDRSWKVERSEHVENYDQLPVPCSPAELIYIYYCSIYSTLDNQSLCRTATGRFYTPIPRYLGKTEKEKYLRSPGIFMAKGKREFLLC